MTLTFELAEAPSLLTRVAGQSNCKANATRGAAALSSLQAVVQKGWPGVSWSPSGILALCRPEDHGVCDHNRFERVVNVLTSLPFFAIGYHTMRNRESFEGRLYGASVMGVGAGAVVYHCSHGPKWRPIGRKVDYWCIALSTTLLLRAVMPGTSRRATCAAVLLTPFQPLAVTSAHAAAAEFEYLRRSSLSEAMKRHQQRHALSAMAGASCFVLEELTPKLPLIHSIWHGLSAYCVASMNYLLEDIEADAKRAALQQQQLEPPLALPTDLDGAAD